MIVDISNLFEQNEENLTNERKKIFVLVGPPSVGKSTWIQDAFDEAPYIINRDEVVEAVAGPLGWSYDDMFVTPPGDATLGEIDEKYGEVVKAPRWMSWSPTAFSLVLSANRAVSEQFDSRVQGAVSSGLNIVVDMTNMNAKARKRALASAGGGDYEKVAVVFEFQGAEEIIQKVAAKRSAAAERMGKSKTIPSTVFANMFKMFSRPTKSEGFDRIVSIDNRALLKKLASDTIEESLKHRFMKLAGVVTEASVTKLADFRKNKKNREGYRNEVIVSSDGLFVMPPEELFYVVLSHRDQADALADGDLTTAEGLGAKVYKIKPDKR